ncbi:ribulose-phosphate 3-epimerase [Zophobihabitans entericus]|uniref:Ribulose-phosphate 3-epimerase n=1 Tax=Zophobihabitans entericus TaxID=1635327 RepID=A0A6G9I8N8_9GAMM|nr:ribulose-phosphate 3-epimerase [Zophobihabitans entericus]QIQ20581.1 ribulose-phosphate 3-epimerase [Zophobihabitans entericus]
MNSRAITLSPSIMCADISALKASIQELENVGIKTLHVDVIDGAFSPSMPLGVDTIKKIRDLTNMELDVHIMSLNNEYFINEMLSIGVQSISFHIETSLHIDRHINLIKKKNVKAGVALNPATSLSVLDYVLPQCDQILLMLINPGFATDKNEQQVSYAAQKVRDLKQLIINKNLNTQIQVDGRVSLEKIPDLLKAGADNLVLGSTSLYIPGKTLQENKAALDAIITNVLG